MPLINQVLDDTVQVIPNGSVPHVVSLCGRVQGGPPGLIVRGVPAGRQRGSGKWDVAGLSWTSWDMI